MSFPDRGSTSTLSAIARELADALEADVPLDKAIERVAAGVGDPALSKSLTSASHRIRAGDPPHLAFESLGEDVRGLLGPLFDSSRQTGDPGSMLRTIVSFQIARDECLRLLRSVLSYPIVVLLCTLGTLAVLAYVSLPVYLDFLSENWDEIPLGWRLAYRAAGSLRVLVPAAAAVAAALLAASLFPRARGLFARPFEAIPVIGRTFLKINKAFALKQLGILLDAGMGLSPALRVASAMSDSRLGGKLAQVASRVEEGHPFAEELGRTGILDKSIAALVGAGAVSGKIPEAVLAVTRTLERDIELDVKMDLFVVENAAIVSCGLVVAVVLWGFYLLHYYGIAHGP